MTSKVLLVFFVLMSDNSFQAGVQHKGFEPIQQDSWEQCWSNAQEYNIAVDFSLATCIPNPLFKDNSNAT
jgi:hypothetical protein